ncbi:MAG: hypothetical protein P8M80_19080 [Pirellulaceae bacterium]|nr:hypothetical protein [Mariniblastus sp.]MDB4757160.1 hypothetical protein [Mariniblastus sp.]MDG2471394.1 hypothetical protein [Pirellulaceae bacterium]
MDSIPHERSLVKKYKGRPFVILGVNMGEDGGDVASMEKKYEVSWRSFSSREDQGIPDIADTLELDAAGYAMLIDAKGIIRFKGPESKLDADYEIEALVQQAELLSK